MENTNDAAEHSAATDCYVASGWVVETTEFHPSGPGLFWRPGHSGNQFYNAVCGMWNLNRAKIFRWKKDAINACVQLKSKEGGRYNQAMFRVREITLQVGRCVYPPSQST